MMVLRQTTALQSKTEAPWFVPMRALRWHGAGAEGLSKRCWVVQQKKVSTSATMQCDVIGKSHVGLTKILKTKQHDITTNSKITPESTPLNTISTEVYIIWKKDLLQGCGRDHWFMATPNKQQGSVFCSWKNWAKQPLKKRHFLAACCTALWSYPRVLMQDRCRSVGSVLNLNESIPTYIKYYTAYIEYMCDKRQLAWAVLSFSEGNISPVIPVRFHAHLPPELLPG